MWPIPVEVQAPGLNDGACLLACTEPLGAQALVAELAVNLVAGFQYNATGLPGEPVAPFIFSGDHTNRNS
jgi:hypothetical protein